MEFFPARFILFVGLFLVGCGAQGAITSSSAIQAEDAKPDRSIKGDELKGIATWYGKRFQGRKTANGERFDVKKLTAAHKTFPFGTIVRVVRDDTRQSVVVRINDRGPFSKGRVIDLSEAAASEIDLIQRGTTPVHLEILRWGE